MADVVLINLEQEDRAVPFGLLYIGTYLEKRGFSVKIFNFEFSFNQKLDENILKEITLDSKNAICIGFSVMTSQIQNSLYLTKLLKKRYPEIPIIWGGIHPTLFPEQTIKNEFINFIVVGEGEETMPELCEAIKKKDKERISRIKGIAFKDKNKIIITEKREVIDMGKTPRPNWKLIDEFVKRNLMRFVWGKTYRGTEIHTGRGCPYRCTYCINSILYGKKWLPRNVKDIVNEIEFLKKRYKIEFVKLRDENFFLNRKRVEDFCDELIKRNLNIKWETNTRANYFDNCSEDFMKKLKKSGCVVLAFGAESGSLEMLDYMKKDITPEQILNSVRLCTSYGILPNYSFMIGIPTEEKQDVVETFQLVKKMKKISNEIGFLGPQIFRPYPGCELYNECKKLGFNEPKDLESWTNINKVSQFYVDTNELPWIKDPELVDVVAKYAPKGFNNYLTNVPIIWRFIFNVKSFLFENLTFAYVKTNSETKRKIIKNTLILIDKTSLEGKKIAKKTLKALKYY